MLKHYSLRDFVIQLLLAALITLAMGLAVVANAQESMYDASFNSTSREGIPINVLVGQSRVINFDRAIGRFSISKFTRNRHRSEWHVGVCSNLI